MKKVYCIVTGSGDYSDRCTWPVLAYMDKEAAQTKMGELEMLEAAAWKEKKEIIPYTTEKRREIDAKYIAMYEQMGIDNVDGDNDWELHDMVRESMMDERQRAALRKIDGDFVSASLRAIDDFYTLPRAW